MTFEIRSITEDEVEAYFVAISAGFGSTNHEDDLGEYRKVADYPQSFAALDGGRFVGGAGAYNFDMTLPGGAVVAVGGVSCVSVAPTHRRRGVVTGLMAHQLDDLAERGKHLAILNASESRIYRRFGYGLGASAVSVEIDTRHSEYLGDLPDGQLHLVSRDEALEVFPTVYDQWRLGRVGSLSRSEAWWSIMLGAREGWKGGGDAFHVIHEGAGGSPDGYVSYQPDMRTEHGNFQGVVRVRELIGLTPDVEAALWRFCFDLDLVRRARSDMRPVDDPIRWRLVEPRQLRVHSLTDVLWLRLVDTAAALSVRGYRGEDALIIDVADRFRPDNSGTFRLETGTDGAECTRTSEAPDLRLGVEELGAAYLGGVSFSTLRAAGLVDECTAGAVTRADAVFATDRAPYCATTF